MDTEFTPLLTRIAEALERLAPRRAGDQDLTLADAFVWDPGARHLKPVETVNRVPLSLLKGIDRQVRTLLENTAHHANGLPANNALLWGARGTGKSSLVKAVHAEVNRSRSGDPLVLIEIHREDIPSLPHLLDLVRNQPHHCVIFCDDLSFEGMDDGYKALKAVLEGGLEGRPDNVVFYATSNRRHMMARDMIENERSAAIHQGEAIEEKVSLSDRFGLWLGFHHLDQETYFEIVSAYANEVGLKTDQDTLLRDAKEWSVTRGSRSGRVAWQFIQHLAGQQGVPISLNR